MDFIPYNRKFKDRVRELRKSRNLAEVLLWNEVKAKKLGYQFLRQRPVDNYIIDLYCKELKLAIEIDGSSHQTKFEQDKFRQEQLESFNITFLRFSDFDVCKNIDHVLGDIRENILRLAQASPPPSKEEPEQ